MKIPKKFKLLGHEIIIEYDKNFHNKEDYVGHAKFRLNKIIIDNNNSRPLTQIEETFLHELTHWILYSMQNKLWNNEKFVDQFSGLLHQALTTMEYK